MVASQIQAIATAAQKPRTTAGLADPDATPAKPARNSNPLIREYHARAGVRCEPIAKQAATRAAKPMPPATKCSVPCQLIDAGGPAGVPAGKPSCGSARKTPAQSRLTP